MKDKLFKYIKENKIYILTFILSVTLIGIVFFLNDVVPFGKNSLLDVDFYHQYGPMLGELYDRVTNGDNLIYSFRMGLGLPFFRNFLNYLSSPFNIIMFLFNRENLLMSFSIIIGLKVAFSSFTMIYYLSKKFNKKSFLFVPLALLYSFQAYFVAFYWNIMWLDVLVFIPLITLGIESIVNNKSWKLYTFSLATLLFANYFMGYIVCIFSVIYFILYNLYKTSFKKDKLKENMIIYLKKCFIFGISSLLSGCLVAFLLLPMAKSITSISATGDEFPTSQYYDFSLLEFVSGHFTGVDSSVLSSDPSTSPNISCGILVIFLVLMYILNSKISLKNKLCYLLLIFIFASAFFIPSFDFIMHAFHVPNDLPYRYSFLYSFILIIMAAYSINNIKTMKFRMICLIYILLMGLLIYLTNVKLTNLNTDMIYLNIVLLSIYFFILAIQKAGLKYKKILISLVICLSSLDIVMTINNNWEINQLVEDFYYNFESKKEILNSVKVSDGETYRIEDLNNLTLNDGSWYNYNGMTGFSSMAYEKMAVLQYQLGMPGNHINSYIYMQTTPLYDLLFNMKYFIGKDNDGKRYSVFQGDGKNVINKFNYNVGLGFGVKDDLKNWTYTSSNPFSVQNDFFEKSTGVANILEEIRPLYVEEFYEDSDVKILKYTYKNTHDNMYFYTNDNFTTNFFVLFNTVYYNDENYEDILSRANIEYEYTDNYGKDDENYVVNVSSKQDYIEVLVGYNSDYCTELKVTSINHDKFVEAYDYLKQYKLNIDSFKENVIDGNITLDKDMMVYTSIPYDDGWHVFVDGKEIETYKLGEALLSFECNEGNHKIKIVYKIPYFKSGIIISFLSILGIVAYEKFIKKRLSKNK